MPSLYCSDASLVRSGMLVKGFFAIPPRQTISFKRSFYTSSGGANSSIASKGSARSWIFQVAYTQALIRRRQLKTHGFYASPITDRTFENSSCGTKGAHYDDTVEGFFGRNGWRNVWDSLTECQRETLRLHFYEGCTFTEIAEKLGQSYVNIRHHYYRGLEKLRKHADENDLNWP